VIYNEKYIKECEDKGWINSNCKMCLEVFYPKLRAGAAISDIFAPSHKPSNRCESGKRLHCSCDICF